MLFRDATGGLSILTLDKFMYKQILSNTTFVSVPFRQFSFRREPLTWFFVILTKGQLISKCPFGVIVWTKIPTKKFDKFLP